ncbi:hypothetical protein FH950_001597 [Enterococcus faecium]|nr:hypothetical protein [Enterococcus faecium]
MKKLVQYNEVVFNHTAYIEDFPQIATEFKNSKNTFAYSHGDYSPERSDIRKVNSKQFDVTFMVDKRKFPCESRELVEQFVLDNFYKIGRLWAIEGDLLLWTVAKVLTISEGYDEKRNYLSFTVSFYIPSGIWHVADPYATYFDDYHYCDILDCYESLERELCGCSFCLLPDAPVKRCLPCHGERLCEIPKNKLADVIGKCGNEKKISFSCCDSHETAIGHSQVGETTALLQFDGHTLYETEEVAIEISGKFNDLGINWNGKQSIVEGSYSGKTTIIDGLVKNECKYLPIEKFHTICSHTTDCLDRECYTDNPRISVSAGGSRIVQLSVVKGTNIVIFSGFVPEELQSIKVYVGGIAL